MDAYMLRPEELPDLTIEKLGDCQIESPLTHDHCKFTPDDQRVRMYSYSSDIEACEKIGQKVPSFELAGPRSKIYFDPAKLNAGIVTCGGLCPGLNDVIRTIVLALNWQYGVKNVLGFRYGYAGLTLDPPAEPIMLTEDLVDDIHLKGGDILSSSRGPQDPDEMVDTLLKYHISLLFVIGGDGTLRGAADIVNTIKKRDLNIAVIGVPKTIDNDISGIARSFGFSTAVGAARAAICGAHEEAKGAYNGIGLVKLMGRDSGFITAYATLSNSDVNFCFIPEEPLILEGKDGFLSILERRLAKKRHAVIVVAEGAGQHLVNKDCTRKDASGNTLHADIGVFLREKIKKHFKTRGIPVSMKYIDPSYIIRSVPADSFDSAFCLMLGQYAVHAGMTGRTNMVVGFWNENFTHVPIAVATLKRKKIDPNGPLWQTVLMTTGQARNHY